MNKHIFNIRVFEPSQAWMSNRQICCEDIKDMLNPRYIWIWKLLFASSDVNMIRICFVYSVFHFRWNPFARKSRGILGVIKAQAKRNRVVSKHGRINVYRKTEDNENQHRFEKQNTFSLSLFYSVQTFTTSVSNIVYVNHNSDLSDRNCYLHTYVGWVESKPTLLEAFYQPLQPFTNPLTPHLSLFVLMRVPNFWVVVSKYFYRYLKDFFTSMIDLAWTWTLLWFCAAFYLSWLVFSVVWFLFLLMRVSQIFSVCLISGLVPDCPGPRWPGPRGPWPWCHQSLCRECQGLHIRISVQPRDAAHNRVKCDK